MDNPYLEKDIKELLDESFLLSKLFEEEPGKFDEAYDILRKTNLRFPLREDDISAFNSSPQQTAKFS